MVGENRCLEYDDGELVALSIKDSQYFYCLMKRYEDKLSRYVGRMTYLADEDIADVIQESFIRAYTHLNECDCDLKFSSWMYRIVHNQAINKIKKNRDNLRIGLEDKEEFVEWLTDEVNIEKEAIKKESDEGFKLMLDKLKPEYKEVLVLRFFEDKDYAEISDILEKPMGTVATLISRAKEQFRRIYEKTN
jgi:RNA polymerase sigma-70 factor (ECF subfamily)